MLVTEKAMLAKLKISRWGASKHDRTISEQVAQQHQADPSMGRYSKRLIAKEPLEEIRIIATKARHHHYNNTMPWLDDGARVLPAASYFEYMQEQNALKAEFEAAVADFVYNYPKFRDEAQRRLNGLFDPADYPDKASIGKKFSMDIEVEQMPEADDFRVSLSEDENARIREQIQARLDQGVEGAMKDVWKRIFTAVEHMVERLRAYEVDEDGKAKNAFRDTLVDNVRGLVELLPKLNITGSNELEDMRHRLADNLCEIGAAELRGDSSLRNSVATKAETILADLKDFMA